MTNLGKRPAARRTQRTPVPSAVEASKDVISRRLGDEVILVNLETDRVYALNQTAARFWELLVARRSAKAIEQRLAREFDVDPKVLVRSLDRLRVALEAKKLIVRAKRRR